MERIGTDLINMPVGDALGPMGLPRDHDRFGRQGSRTGRAGPKHA